MPKVKPLIINTLNQVPMPSEYGFTGTRKAQQLSKSFYDSTSLQSQITMDSSKNQVKIVLSGIQGEISGRWQYRRYACISCVCYPECRWAGWYPECRKRCDDISADWDGALKIAIDSMTVETLITIGELNSKGLPTV